MDSVTKFVTSLFKRNDKLLSFIYDNDFFFAFAKRAF